MDFDFSNIVKLINKENITLFLSVVGFFGTVFNGIYYWVTNHRNIDISINGYSYVAYRGLLVHISISNKSKTAISITDLCLTHNGLSYPCVHIPQKVLDTTSRRGKEILSHCEYFSMEMPINISGLSGKSGYVYFPLDREIDLTLPNNEEFVICTNHGNPMRTKLELKNKLR